MSVLKSSKTKIAAVAAASVLSIGIFSGIEFGQADKADEKRNQKMTYKNGDRAN